MTTEGPSAGAPADTVKSAARDPTLRPARQTVTLRTSAPETVAMSAGAVCALGPRASWARSIHLSRKGIAVTKSDACVVSSGEYWLPDDNGDKLLEAVRFRMAAEARQQLPYVPLKISVTYALALAIAQVQSSAMLANRMIGHPISVGRKALDALKPFKRVIKAQGYGNEERAHELRLAEKLLRRLSRQEVR